MSSSAEELFQNYADELDRASEDPNIQLALSRAVKSYRNNTKTALERFPHTVQLAEEVLEIKKKAIDNLEELLDKARESLEYNHAKTYFAKTREDVYKILDEIIGTQKLWL